MRIRREQFSVHVIPVAVVWSSCDDNANTLCTSGFDANVKFSHNGTNTQIQLWARSVRRNELFTVTRGWSLLSSTALLLLRWTLRQWHYGMTAMNAWQKQHTASLLAGEWTNFSANVWPKTAKIWYNAKCLECYIESRRVDGSIYRAEP